MNLNLPVLDLVIIIVYLIGMIVLGLWASRRMRTTSTGYYLAGRSLSWPIVGAALFASNISTIHLIGLAADGICGYMRAFFQLDNGNDIGHIVSKCRMRRSLGNRVRIQRAFPGHRNPYQV